MIVLTMSDATNPNQNDAEKEKQTQHVMTVALSNLSVVIDQLETLKDDRVATTLEALNSAKVDLQKQIA